MIVAAHDYDNSIQTVRVLLHTRTLYTCIHNARYTIYPYAHNIAFDILYTENTFYIQRTHSTYREHILLIENTFYIQRTHSIYKEHILYTENTFYMPTYKIAFDISIYKEHILYTENTFYIQRTHSICLHIRLHLTFHAFDILRKENIFYVKGTYSM